VNVDAGLAIDIAGNTNTASNQNKQILSLAGNATIDLGDTEGVSNGQLINGIQLGDKWYYFWDKSDNGETDFSVTDDKFTSSDLSDIFNENIDGQTEDALTQVGVLNKTDNTFRYANINDVLVALPTYGGTLATNPNGTAGEQDRYISGTEASESNGSITYSDLLGIWDNYNGDSTATNTSGAPSGWGTRIWSATPSTSGHLYVGLDNGFIYDSADNFQAYVVLQVF
jgi:hypothetical protein